MDWFLSVPAGISLVQAVYLTSHILGEAFNGRASMMVTAAVIYERFP